VSRRLVSRPGVHGEGYGCSAGIRLAAEAGFPVIGFNDANDVSDRGRIEVAR